MKKKLSILVLILLPIFMFALLSNKPYKKIDKTANAEPTTINKIKGDAKLTYMSENLDQLIADSSFIIEGIATDKQDDLIFQTVPFVTTNIKIEKVLKGNLTYKEITLLQTKITEDPLVKKGGHVLLFLEKYEGPIINDAYVCKGLYQGNYNINDKGIITNSIDLKSYNLKLSDDIEKTNSLEGLQVKIKNKGL